MPNLPWAEAIKDGAIEKVFHAVEYAQETHNVMAVLLAANTEDARAEISRLLRAVEVLGEAVEREAAKECEHTRNKTRVCTEAGHPPIYWCNPCRARRALAHVREW